MDGRRAADPIVTELVRNGVIAVTEEMKTNLMRTAYNMIIYEALDFTVGLFTPSGETVSIGLGLPMFIRGMTETVRAKIRHFGLDGIEPGDILVTNDSYITGSHLNHVTLTMPIFHGGVLAGFSCCMAHWLDIGGVLGGMTTDIFAEGLQIPILKLHRAGVVNQDLVDVIRQNVRIPTRALGDLRAQVTAVKTGERRFRELCDRYGREPVRDAIAAIMDHAEAAARARTRTIPDGVYEAESFMDDDGVEIGKPIPIRVRVEVAGDAMTIDLSEVARQVRGFYNSGITTGHACAQVAYKCLTSPRDYPINDGAFRSLTSIVPPGTVVSATRPAPMRWWMTFPMTIVDTVFKALAPAIPDRVIAGHHADLVSSQVHGIDPRTRDLFIGNFGPLGGGWGAKRREDGMSATVCLNDGDTHNAPNEQVEVKFPIVVERYALAQDSGGAGRHRGGLGIDRVVRARTGMTLNTQIERAHCKPWGLEGGLDGEGNRVWIRNGAVWKSDFPNAKVLVARLETDDAFRVRSGGGGGHGSPLERPVEAVAHDVRQGYVSVEAAAELYGVVADPITLEVDFAATERLRVSRKPRGEPRMSYKLLSYRDGKDAQAGVLVGESVYDAAKATGVSAYSSVTGMLEDWNRARRALAEAAKKIAAGKSRVKGRPLARTRLLAPVLYPGAIFCAGANYRDHMLEMARVSGSAPEPDPHEVGLKPWHFIKTSRSSIVGPGARVQLPPFSQKVDWEVELAAVIGRPARNVSIADALKYVAGYTIANDLSARDAMRRPHVPDASPFKLDWLSQKCFEGACPLGPWITPASEIPDPQKLALKLWIDDELMQDSHTSQMIFTTAEQIAHLSTRMTLQPGDLILTGTPAGVGMGRGRFLKAGETLRLWIEGIGELRHTLTD